MTSNYSVDDPRSRLQASSQTTVTTNGRECRAPSLGDFWKTSAEVTDGNDNPAWILRSANAVITLHNVQKGTVLSRQNNTDEYMVLMDFQCKASFYAGDNDSDKIEAPQASLTIVPPGKSRLICHTAGYVLRCFTSRATDLLEKAQNADAYKEGAPECAPLKDWPDPPDGFKLRNYDLQNMKSITFAHIIRSTNLMFSSMMRRTKRRPDTALSPHSHDDFEQFSITLEGDWVHYLRVPWTANKNHWTPDYEIGVKSPSATVIPAKVVHTSQDVGEGNTWLVDIFAPVREDFSQQKGWVLNADEYPAPWEK